MIATTHNGHTSEFDIALPILRTLIGPARLLDVMADFERATLGAARQQLQPIATGFSPLDDVLNGGLRPGDLMVLGGQFGVGKTILSLQMARNVVVHNRNTAAMYVCYEHDRLHLLQRLLCMESAEMGLREQALTLRKLLSLTGEAPSSSGLMTLLRASSHYAPVVEKVEEYGERLFLAKASGSNSTLDQLAAWATQLSQSHSSALLVIDYLNKIPVGLNGPQNENETTTFVIQALKELAMTTGVRIVVLAASDRAGLKSKRMRLADLRGSSALQYEADVGVMLNNKHEIVSREHLVYNQLQAEAMRNWLVLSVEKNRSGRNMLDLEFALDAAHFRVNAKGGYVQERLIDERVVLA